MDNSELPTASGKCSMITRNTGFTLDEADCISPTDDYYCEWGKLKQKYYNYITKNNYFLFILKFILSLCISWRFLLNLAQ
jgi:hypothetical protein